MACCMARRKEKDDGDIFDDGDDATAPQKDSSPPPDPLADDSHPESTSQPQVGHTAVYGLGRTRFWCVSQTGHPKTLIWSCRAFKQCMRLSLSWP